MTKFITLKRGHDLKLAGEIAAGSVPISSDVTLFAVCPDDFPGFVPKLEVREGDNVLSGQSLMHDKNSDQVKLVSPVAGTIKRIVRGERRKILFVEIERSDNQESAKFNLSSDAAQLLQNSGLWAMMRQRPYDIVPHPDAKPVNIFITAFSSTPLAAPFEINPIVNLQNIEAGVKLLSTLTDGKIFISIRNEFPFTEVKGAEIIVIKGSHPAGNAGVQAANIAPVNKGETIWTLDIITLCRIGKLILESSVDWSAQVAVAGPEVKVPSLVNSLCGANIAQLTEKLIKDNDTHKRIISGDVLSGVKVDNDGWLRYPYRQVTVIAEGDDRDEFMGWASLNPQKLSLNRSFLSWLMPKKKFSPDARLQGGHRSMIMSGTYESMLPMDIMAEPLIKAILGNDIEKMEQLGIYEIAPEDFALAEYADPSKLELQKIVRQGLDKLRKELE